MTAVVTITVSPRAPSTGAATPLYLAGGGNLKPYRYPDAGAVVRHWRAGITALPRFRAEIGFDENGWNGAARPATSAIAWAPSTKADLSALAAYYWPKAVITIQEGNEATEVFTTRLSGKVADATIEGGQLIITAADLGDDLTKPLVTARFAGTGGAEGGIEAKNRIKRRSWGRVFNVEGRIRDKANNIYEFGDPAFPLQSVAVLRDMGRDASPAPAVLAWQGSIAATDAALVASAPVKGSGVVAPSIASAKWWTQPAGPLTADLLGEIGTGYVETVSSIAERILAAIAGPAVTNVAAANGWRAAPAGIHVDENETIAATLDRLLMGVSLVWVLDPAGTVTLRELTFTGPIDTLISDRVQRVRTLPPVKTRRIGYQKAYRTHNDGEIATSLLEASAAFIQNDPPDLSISLPGTNWLDADDGFRAYVRVDGTGLLSIGGNRIILGGGGIALGFTGAPDQRIHDAIDVAAAATAKADAALDALADIDDDGILDVSEKVSSLIPMAADLEASWGILDTQATGFGITTERTAAAAARTAWLAVLAAIAPAWNNVDLPSPVARGGLDSARLAYRSAIDTLDAAIKAKAALTATWDAVRDSQANSPSNSADVTADAQISLLVDDLQYVYFDYTGAAKTGQLTRPLANVLLKGGADISSSATWTFTPGACTITAGSNGALTLNTISGSTAAITVKATYGGKDYIGTIQLVKVQDDPPSGGSGGATFSVGVSGTVNETAYTTPIVIAAPTQMATNGSGQARLIATVNYDVPTHKTGHVSVKWQRCLTIGGTYVDAGVSATGSDAYGGSSGHPGEPDPPTSGSAVTNALCTATTASTTFYWRLVAFYAVVTGPITSIDVSGTAGGAQS